MSFTAEAGDHRVGMDAKPPLGAGSALSPKELVLGAVCGCSAMDVVGLLRKYRQPLNSFQIEATAEVVEKSHPAVFKEIRILYRLSGPLDSEKVLQAVVLSQTKYCSVSAMLSKAVPIFYEIELDGKRIGEGKANFVSEVNQK